MPAFLSGAEAQLGKRLTMLCAAAAALGLIAIAFAFASGRQAAALSALAASWLFFAGLAAGGVALSAAARLAQGRFLEPALPLAESPAAFFPIAIVLLAAVVGFARAWMPAQALSAATAMAIRDLASAAVLFALGATFLRRSRDGRWTAAAVARLAIAYLVTYAIALSVWAIDLVMALTDAAPSAIVPVQTFMAALLSAIAFSALLAARRVTDVTVRLDLGRLLYGFAAFWAYLVWCSFLPVWYANLPEEVTELLERTEGGWEWLSWGVIVLAFVVPFVVLLAEAAKRSRLVLGLAALSVLTALYGERFLLVLRPSQPGGGAVGFFVGVLVAAGVLGGFALVVAARLSARPAPAAT